MQRWESSTKNSDAYPAGAHQEHSSACDERFLFIVLRRRLIVSIMRTREAGARDSACPGPKMKSSFSLARSLKSETPPGKAFDY